MTKTRSQPMPFMAECQNLFESSSLAWGRRGPPPKEFFNRGLAALLVVNGWGHQVCNGLAMARNGDTLAPFNVA